MTSQQKTDHPSISEERVHGVAMWEKPDVKKYGYRKGKYTSKQMIHSYTQPPQALLHAQAAVLITNLHRRAKRQQANGVWGVSVTYRCLLPVAPGEKHTILSLAQLAIGNGPLPHDLHLL